MTGFRCVCVCVCACVFFRGGLIRALVLRCTFRPTTLLTAPTPYPTHPPTHQQAKAIHVASCIETRCAVHHLVFERLIDRVGTEGAAHAGAGGAHAAGGPWGHTTTIINTTHASAAGGSAALHAQIGANATATAQPAAAAGGGGGPFFALFLGVVGFVRVVIGVVFTAGGMIAKLLALTSFLTAAKAVLAVKSGAAAVPAPQQQQQQFQPAWAGVGGGGLPLGSAAVPPSPPGGVMSPAVSAALSTPRAHPLGGAAAPAATTSSNSAAIPSPSQQQYYTQPPPAAASEPAVGGSSSDAAVAGPTRHYFDALRPAAAGALPTPVPVPARSRGRAAAMGAMLLGGVGAAGGGVFTHAAAALKHQRQRVFGRYDPVFDDDDCDVDGGWGIGGL